MKLLPREPTGEMWSNGRRVFANRAEESRAKDSHKSASVIADIAPAEIYEAMHDAAPSEATELVRGVLRAARDFSGAEPSLSRLEKATDEALAHPDVKEWLNG